MQLKLTSIALAMAFAFATAAQAQTTQTPAKPDTKRTEQPASDRKVKNAEEDAIEKQAKADKAKCDSMKANAKDICMAEAKGKEKVAKAELDAKHAKDKVKAEQKVKDAKAEAAYDVASQRCDDQKGEAKDACIKQAKIERDKMKGKAEKTADVKRENRAATGSTAPERKPEQPKQKP
ncbi:MAG TPA: hypothetical protein VM756_05490 [Burkholderiales bacterium]|jgi:hypothetical protein|nr:hypothetical protein [Burkholderiales bacterium]